MQYLSTAVSSGSQLASRTHQSLHDPEDYRKASEQSRLAGTALDINPLRPPTRPPIYTDALGQVLEQADPVTISPAAVSRADRREFRVIGSTFLPPCVPLRTRLHATRCERESRVRHAFGRPADPETPTFYQSMPWSDSVWRMFVRVVSMSLRGAGYCDKFAVSALRTLPRSSTSSLRAGEALL